MNILMIGSESSHAAHFASALKSLSNNESFHVSDLWTGDGTNYACDVQTAFPKVNFVEDVEATIARSDGVIITLRRASEHFDYATLAIQHKKPVFVDKPFTDTPGRAQILLELGKENNVVVSGGSTLCYLNIFEANLSAIRNATTVEISFYADPSSPYEGIRFYGSHLTDLYSMYSSGLPERITLSSNCEQYMIDFFHNSQNVRLTMRNSPSPVLITFDDETIELSQTKCYMAGMEHFTNILRNKKASDSERLLRSVKLMSMIEKSFEQKYGLNRN